jgi:hypothetical protein
LALGSYASSFPLSCPRYTCIYDRFGWGRREVVKGSSMDIFLNKPKQQKNMGLNLREEEEKDEEGCRSNKL